MRAFLASTALGIAMIGCPTPVFGANEPEQGGSTGRIVTALVDAEHGADAAAYAVVCAALWGHAAADHDLYRARGRAVLRP